MPTCSSLTILSAQAWAEQVCRSMDDGMLNAFANRVEEICRGRGGGGERFFGKTRTALLVTIDGELGFHNDREATVLERFPGVSSWEQIASGIANRDAIWRDGMFCQMVYDHFATLSWPGIDSDLEEHLCDLLPNDSNARDDGYLDFYELEDGCHPVFEELQRLAQSNPSALMDALKRSQDERAIHCYFVGFEDDAWLHAMRGAIRFEPAASQ